MTTFYTDNEASAITSAENIARQKADGIIALKSSRIAVVYGDRSLFDDKVCVLRGLLMYQTWHIGGTIVCFPGDLSIMAFSHEAVDFGQACVNAVRDWLQEKCINAYTQDNDLIVSGKKCGSWAKMRNGNYSQTVVHFSVNIDEEIVNDICKKQSKKIPGALSQYGVSAENLFEVIQRIL